MRDLDLVDAALSASTGEGLPTHDPRLVRVARLRDERDHEAAADLAEEQLAAGVVDIRLVTPVLFAAFLDGGVARLGEIFSRLDRMLTEHGDRIGPRERWPEHVHRSLAALLGDIEGTLAYHQSKQDPRWLELAAGGEPLAAALSALDRLVEGRGEEGIERLDEPRSRLQRVLRDLKSQEVADGPDEPAAQAASAPPPSRPERGIPDPEGATVELRGSPELRVLLAKLRAFETLTRRGDHRKAALVAADVQDVIDDFDPRLFFPELFSSFGALLSEHVDSFAPYWEQRESLGWRMLDQYYRVDLSGFVGEE